MRLSAEEKGSRVFDELLATDKASVHQLVKGCAMSRASVYDGIRWLRDRFGEKALVCDADNNYAFALSKSDVIDYRYRRLSFHANSLERHARVLGAGEYQFGADADEVIAGDMVRTAVKLLRRGATGGTTSRPALERV
jgi:hypothetical protein